MVKTTEIKVNHKVQYFAFQVVGWGFLIFIIALFNVKQNGLTKELFIFLGIVFSVNVLASHLYRFLVNYYKWLQSKISILLFRIVASSIFLGVIFSISVNLFSKFISPTTTSLFTLDDWLVGTILYFIWSILYFGYLLFYKARKEEYKNMQMLALNTEAELKNLRSQLNPHFMFNAMNSIRALVDEDPEQSKKAITQLSNVLRNALIHSKKNLITLKEEMNLVEDYLSLEKIRYEERLKVIKRIEPECLVILVPPLLIQTITENAIKHGISKLINGGVITYEIKVVDDYLSIIISNTGKINSSEVSETGIGVQNTIKRLRLIYGNDATFNLRQVGNEVKTELLLLLKK